MEISPILVQIGPLAIRWYSVMIILGIIAAVALATHEARRRGDDPDHIWGMFPWVLILGIVGARVGWDIVSLSTIEARGWLHLIFTWEGGLSIQGALVGGIAGALIYCRLHRLSFLRWADIIIPGVALAQAIGRWGNFFNQELFGAPCNQPWCIPISDAVLRADPRFAAFAGQGLHFAPTFAYEMLWDLFNCALLLWLARRPRLGLRTGDLLWTYGIVYSVGRFFLEDVRLDSAIVAGVKAPQFVAGLTIVLCFAIMIWRRRPGSRAPLSYPAGGATSPPAEAAPAPELARAVAADDAETDEAPLPAPAERAGS